jgi:hypothetical protein
MHRSHLMEAFAFRRGVIVLGLAWNIRHVAYGVVDHREVDIGGRQAFSPTSRTISARSYWTNPDRLEASRLCPPFVVWQVYLDCLHERDGLGCECGDYSLVILS